MYCAQSRIEAPKAVPPPQKISDILESIWRIFVDSLVLNCAFLYDQNSKKIHPECMECHGD